MKASALCILCVVPVVLTSLMAQEVRLSTHLVGGAISIDFPTEPGRHYEVEMSTDLRDWGSPILSRAGDGQILSHEVTLVGGPVRFFRLVVRGAVAGFAPEPSTMQEALVGVTWQGYRFQSANRFDWSGEAGSWQYQKTGPDTGLLILTYDEDGNDAGVYREEVVLVFETESTGTYRYSEYTLGIEDPGSVVVDNMDFRFLLDLSPSAEVMGSRLVGATWEGYVFTGVTRFDWESPGHTGEWRYEKTGRQTGLLIFTYDKDNNDPQVYREQMTLTFSREDRGTALYSEYVNGVKRASRDRIFAFTLPSIPPP